MAISYRIALEIAHLPTELKCSDESFVKQLKDYYKNFLAQTSPRASVSITVSSQTSPASHSSYDPSIHLSLKQDKIFLKGNEFHGYFNLNTREGEVQQPANVQLTEAFLRALYSHLLIVNQGFMLHASGIVRDNKGYVFFGPSGAGKSTVASLSTNTLLADETIAVRKVNGSYFLFGTPFWQGNNIALSSRKIRGLFALCKDSLNSISRLSPSKGLQRILSSLEFGVKSPDLTKQLFATITEVLNIVPCYEMRFRKDASFWQAIDEATNG